MQQPTKIAVLGWLTCPIISNTRRNSFSLFSSVLSFVNLLTAMVHPSSRSPRYTSEKEEIRLKGDGGFGKLDSLFNSRDRGGDSVMLESPKLELSSPVLFDSPLHTSGTVLGENIFSL
ncbi:unnamed protein product [Camellia sinensis]